MAVVVLRLLLRRAADHLPDREHLDLAAERGGLGLDLLHHLRGCIDRAARGRGRSEIGVAVAQREGPTGAGRARVHDQRARVAVWLGLCAHLAELDHRAVEIEILVRAPAALHRIDPFLRVIVTRLVLALRHAEHLEFAVVPAGDDVEAETAFADVIGGDHLLCHDDRVEQRRVNGAEHGDALGRSEKARRPGDGLQRLAMHVGLAAVTLPAADRQDEVDAARVGHLGERKAILPARRPALRHLRRRASRGTIDAEQAELERVGVVHRHTVALRWGGCEQWVSSRLFLLSESIARQLPLSSPRKRGRQNSGIGVWSSKRRFHFAANLYGEIIRVIGDVRPLQAFAFLHVARQLDVLREAERQIALLQRTLCRHLLAPDAEATLAVQHFAGVQILLRGRGDIGAEAGRCAGRLLAERHARDRDAKLKTDHVDWTIERGVTPSLVRQHGVFAEALTRVLGLALDHDVSAEREMVRNVFAVAIDRRRDLGDALLLQRAARTLRLAHFGKLEARRRREREAVRLRHEPGRVAYGRHLDAGLGAIDEGVEHLRIDRLAIGDVQILVENVPHVVGIGAVIVRLVARALARRDHLETGGTRPIDMLADQRRLIAPGEAVDDARGLGLACEQRACHRVGLDVDHHDVLAVFNGLQRVGDAGLGNAGRLDDDLYVGMLDERFRIGGDVRAAALQRVVKRGCGILLRGPARAFELGAGPLDVEVSDRDDVHALGQPRLRQEHGAELARADQADGDGAVRGFAFEEECVKVHASTLYERAPVATPLGPRDNGLHVGRPRQLRPSPDRQSRAAGIAAAHDLAERVPLHRRRPDLGSRGAGGRVPAETVPDHRDHRCCLLAADDERHPAASRLRHDLAAARGLRARRHRRGRHRNPDGPLATRGGHLPPARQHARADPRHRLGAAVPSLVRARQPAGDPSRGLRLAVSDHLQHLDRREGRQGNLGAFGAGDGRRRQAAVRQRDRAGRPALHSHRFAARTRAGVAHAGRRRDAGVGAVGPWLDDFRRT